MSAEAWVPKDLSSCHAVQLPEYITENIIVRNGEVPAFYDHGKRYWALPGGGRTDNIEVATAYAEQLDRTISANLQPFGRKIMRM